MRIMIPPPKATDFPVGKAIVGTVKCRAEFGMFIDFRYDASWGIDGLLHFGHTPHAEVARGYRVDDRVQAVVTRFEIVTSRLDVALPADPSWLTADVMGLARRIRIDRAFDLLPILADALEDAGCADSTVLAHCRTVEPRDESWLIPLLLGCE